MAARQTTQTTTNKQQTASNSESESIMFRNIPPFSKFPPELRIKIMKEVLPGPREVDVQWDEENQVFKTSVLPPLNLSINVEWRVECLKIYKLAFGTKNSPATIPIDFSKDAVYLSDDQASSEEYNESSSILQRLIPTSHFDKIKDLRLSSVLFNREILEHKFSIIQLDNLENMTVICKCIVHDGTSNDDDVPSIVMVLWLTKMMRTLVTLLHLSCGFHFSRQRFQLRLSNTQELTWAYVEKEIPDMVAREIPSFGIRVITADGSRCKVCYEDMRAARGDEDEEDGEGGGEVDGEGDGGGDGEEVIREDNAQEDNMEQEHKEGGIEKVD